MPNSRKKHIIWEIFSLAILAILFYGIYSGKSSLCPQAAMKKADFALPPEGRPFHKGERIIYNVQLFGIKIGQAELEYLGRVVLDKKEVELITLSTRVTNLQDLEKIYVDSVSFLPLKVERFVTFFGKSMYIVENYDPKNNSAVFIKSEGGKITKETFHSDKPLQNIISLIFLFRKTPSMETGENFALSLPLLKLDMKLTRSVDFKAAGNKYKALLFESVPRKYRFWIDEGPKRIPLRVDGGIAFGNAAMVMKEFISGEN